jgi:hypothetical protein
VEEGDELANAAFTG